MSDWFEQNAPAQATSAGGDWFSRNAPASPSQRPDTSGSMALDFMQGGGAELIGTALGAYNLLRKIPGADKVLPPVSADVQQYAEPPKTVAAKIGGLFTSLGEFALPAGEAAGLTKGAGLLARAGAQAAAAGGTQFVRTGGNVPSAADAAAIGAAGPVVGAALGAAAPVAGRILRTAPGVAADLVGIVNPRAGNILRVGIRAAKAAGAAAEEAAPAADPLLDQIAQGYGVKGFDSLNEADQATVRDLASRMTSNQAAAAPAAPPAYTPRPPEYYGVKPTETPPAAPAQPATPATPPISPEEYYATRPAAEPTAATPPAEPAAVPAEPIRTAAQEVSPAGNTRETPGNQPKPTTAADIAKGRFAQAKADRFVDAIRRFNSDNPQQALSAEDLAVAGDKERGMLAQGLKQGGYLKNTEQFPDTSFPYILQKLKDAETAARQTIKPPAGFSLGSMKRSPAP